MTARNVLDAAELLYDSAMAANEYAAHISACADRNATVCVECINLARKSRVLREKALARANAEPAGVGRVS